MQRFEDVLTGIMMIIAAVIVLGIACVGAFFFLKSSSFISVTLIFAIGFLTLYTIRRIAIGFSLIIHGRYQDEMTMEDTRRYSH